MTKTITNFGNDTIYGQGGSDTLYGNGGADAFYGGGGNDTIYFDGSDTVINGGSGSDHARYQTIGSAVTMNTNQFTGIEQVMLGTKNDTINVTSSAYNFGSVNGGTGTDTIDARNASAGQAINSVSNIERIYGSNYNDNITGGNNSSTLRGYGGNDTINGGSANDVIYGNSGVDTLNGGTGSDAIYGGSGSDTITGGSGNDVMSGGTGNDTINGGAGNDIMAGDAGNDTINGGSGSEDTANYLGSFGEIIDEMKNGSSAWNISLGAGGTSYVKTSSDGSDSLTGVEILHFADIDINTGTNYGPYAGNDPLAHMDLQGPVGQISISEILSNDFDINQGHVVSSLAIESFTGISSGWVSGGSLFVGFDTSSGSASITYKPIDNTGKIGVSGTISFSYTAVIPGGDVDGPGDFGGIPPLILDLDGDGVELVNPTNSTVLFDIDTNGSEEAMLAWAGADDGILAYDHNNDGIIDRGDEIVLADYHPDAKTDLQGLALAFDSNQDGVFDAADEAWGQFGIWQDANQDGHCETGEWLTLEEAEILSIALASDEEAYTIGNAHVFGTGLYTSTDGSVGEFTDTALGFTEVEPASSNSSEDTAAEAEILELGEAEMAVEVTAAEIGMETVTDSTTETDETTDDTTIASAMAEEDGADSDNEEVATPESQEDENYQQFLNEYNAEMDAIAMSLDEELPDPVTDPDFHVQMAEEIAAVHQIYNEEVLIPESNAQIMGNDDGAVEPVNEMWEFDAIWQDQPDPDFIYG